MQMTPENRKGPRGSTFLALAAAATAGLLMASSASAVLTTVYYSATTDGDFNSGANWNKGYVPGSNVDDQSDTFIMNGHVVTLNSDLSAGTNYRYFSINAKYDFKQNTPATSGTTLTIGAAGKLVGPTQMTLGIQGTINVNGGTYQGGGTTIGVLDTYKALNTGQATFNMNGGLWATGNLKGVGPSSGGSINVGSGATGVLNLSAGTIVTGDYGSVTLGAAAPQTYVANGTEYTQIGDGTINQTGGTLQTGRGLVVGAATVGTYNFSAGVLDAGYNGNQSMQVGKDGNGTFNQTGGTATIGYSVNVGSGTGNGLLSISDGTFASTSYMRVGNAAGTGSGTLRIIGNDGVITLSKGAGSPGALTTYANGTLNFQIGASGVSSITANGSAADGRNLINLSGWLDLDLLGGFVPAPGQSFTLLTTNITASYYEEGRYNDPNREDYLVGRGIITEAGTYSASNSSTHVNTGLFVLPADASSWTYAVVPFVDYTGYSLVATYVPEPASLSVLALGGLALLARRRRTL